MNLQEELDERLLDDQLGEVEGHGPPADLADRVLAKLNGAEAGGRAAPPRRRNAWLVAAVLLAAVALLAAVMVLQRAPDPGPAQDPDLPQEPAKLVQLLGEPARRTAATVALLRLGDQAVPALTAALKTDGPQRLPALTVLERLGAPAGACGAQLAEMLRSRELDETTQLAVLQTASTLIVFADAAAAQALTDESASILQGDMNLAAAQIQKPRAAVAPGSPESSAVWRMIVRRQSGAEVDPGALIKNLTDSNFAVRELAAERLGAGRVAAALPGLANALRSLHTGKQSYQFQVIGGGLNTFTQTFATQPIHLAAARALLQIDPAADGNALATATLLRHGQPDEQLTAAAELVQRTVPAIDRDAVGKLLEGRLMAPGEPGALRGAITAIGQLEWNTPAAVAALTGLQTHADPQVAATAKATLRRLTAK